MRAPSLQKRVLAALAAMVLALGAFAAPALADEAQEPTAILYSNGALVFQLGAEPDPARGGVVDTYTGFDTASYGGGGAPWYGQWESIKSVVVEDAFAPVSTAWWFQDCKNLASADLSLLDTSNVTNMGSMFDGCSSLESLDVSHFGTSNVTSMASMFDGCSSLESLDLSSFDTSKVTYMGSMFYNCTNLASLDVSSFDTSKVTYMGSMFYSCTNLASLDLSSFDTSEVENMYSMFQACSALSSLALGEGFSFGNAAGLPEPPADGKWVRDGSTETYTSADLMSSYVGATMAGVYRRNVDVSQLISIEDATVTAPDQAYTGSALRPLPTVTLGGGELRRGTDYGMIVYEGNVDAGTAAVTVTGMGAYNGTASGTFTITPKSIATPEGKTLNYDGEAKNALDDGSLSPAIQVFLGSNHSAALLANGDLYMWGCNDYGQLGLGSADEDAHNIPTKVSLPSGVVQVSLGDSHSAAVLDNGDLYTWGYNSDGQLGLGSADEDAHGSPTKVDLPAGVAQVSLGSSHSAAVLDNGDLYTWGYNYSGQLGRDDTESLLSPAKVDLPAGVVQVSLGFSHSAAILEGGDLYTWGLNDYGQLGLGNYDWDAHNAPTKVDLPSGVVQVSLGNWHSAAVLQDGTLYTWGCNEYSQLGLGSADEDAHSSPVQVAALSNVVQVSLGKFHSAAVLQDGSLYTWGYNGDSQLGLVLDDTDVCLTPAQVTALSGVVQVSLGDYHSAAVLQNGDLCMWGWNGCGQLGLGDEATDERYAPSAALVPQCFRSSAYDGGVGGDEAVIYLYTTTTGVTSDAVVATESGEYRCYASPGANYCWEDGTRDPVELSWKIESESLASATVTAPDQSYTGSALTPAPTVVLDGKTLVAGTDYTASYSNNIKVGTATVTVTGTGGYTGTASGTFAIEKASLNGTTVKVADQTYTGKALTPAPTVTLDGRTLKAGTDYTASYSNNIKVGTATVTVTGKGSYTGTATGTFAIKPVSIAGATVTTADQAYTGSALTPAPKVVLDGKTLVAGTDYAVSYKDNTNAGTATVTVTGKGIYGGTATGTFTIKAASIAKATVTASDQTYTGSALTPEPTVTLGGKTLVAGTDYTASYANNTEVGTATVTATGKGNYTGTASGTFQITAAPEPEPISIEGAAVTVADQTYTGKALEPAPTVTLGGKTLKAGTDYTASYKDNIEAGTATVTVTGKGSYTGTAEGTFEITAAPEPEPDPEPEPEPADSAWTRLAGSDRFGTMQAITLEGYDEAGTVLVATGIDFADALAAAGLSGVLKAPIVTTMPGSLSDEAKVAVQELGATDAIILGGEAAVSADVEKQLKAMGLSTSRIAGDNRIDTAVRIWERGGSAWGGTCILSKGWVAADALAAGSFAYADAAPLFLAMPDGTLTPETAAAVASFDHVVVLGGTGGDAAISDKTAKSLGTSWMRVAGDTRYETAVALANWASGGDAKAAFQPAVELSWEDCAVAFAWNYPDALVGVNATGPAQSVTLLASTDPDEFTQGVASSVAQHAGEVSHGYVLGGTSVISDAVKALFEQAAK